MSNELIGILGVGVTLMGVGVTFASFIVTGLRGFEKRVGARIDSLERRVDALETNLAGRMDAHETKMEGAMGALEQKLEDRLDSIDNRLGAVERGLARLEGLMDVMRDALFGTRRAASS